MSDRSQQTISPCTAGPSADDLSAWRDATLPAEESYRIAAHSTTCPACQDRLRGFETVATALHDQRVPVPEERLWLAVRAAILAAEPAASHDEITRETTLPDSSGVTPVPQPHRALSRRRRALGTLAAVAAIALVVVGFGRLFQSGAGNRPATTFQVHWRQVTLPGAISKTPGAEATLSVFAADGAVAWLCQSGTKPTPGPMSLWRTTDSGATWQTVKIPTVATSISCQMTLDQLDPNVALLQYGYIDTKATPAMTSGATAISFDGGKSWQSGAAFQFTREFATVNGATYALRQWADDSNRLEVSTDGGATWKILDDTTHNQKLLSDLFWVNPATGGLLLATHSLINTESISFWAADAHGSDWRNVGQSPKGSVAATPTSDGHWSICTLAAGASADLQHPDFRSHVYCGTVTSGWSERPGLDIPRTGASGTTPGTTPSACAGCGQASGSLPYGAMTLVGMANDGAVLATVDDRFDAKGDTTRTSLYRLPAGSSRWQGSGGLPGNVTPGDVIVTYAPRPGGGIFWSTPMQALDNQLAGAVYTASYPGAAAQPLPTQPQQAVTPLGNVDRAAPLEWQPINQPNGFQPRLTNSNVLAVAPSDGQTAYACAQPGLSGTATQLLGWVTHNGGATWTALALPPISGWCALVVDETDPRDVLLGFSHNPSAGGPIQPESYYRSTDGGASWRGIPGLDGSVVYQFASYRGAVYALRNAAPKSVASFAHVQVSTDGMVGWRTIDSGFFSSATSAAQLWLNPYNGELLAGNIPAPVIGASISSATSALFWRSSDGGATWRDLGTPQAPDNSPTNILVQPPQANHTWGICIANNAPGSATLVCGDDGGQSWRPAPLLDTGDPTALPEYTTYTSDGAILAVLTTTTSGGAATYNVYRLPSGANRWQALGPTPEFSLLYAPTPTSGGNGMLWSVPVNGIITDAQGRVFRVAAP